MEDVEEPSSIVLIESTLLSSQGPEDDLQETRKSAPEPVSSDFLKNPPNWDEEPDLEELFKLLSSNILTTPLKREEGMREGELPKDSKGRGMPLSIKTPCN
ncbi:hypothetical protein AMTR_s00001p00272890 [Amborella trichopoda]|uniref:Uncharacterized protein n=1 Tax=Amborella trichopoda TaxID=13333 RepID=W1NMH9_AMBTC|nr:hypothetical protein AMTR_s00001p00272890 [Amborella trichopoda]